MEENNEILDSSLDELFTEELENEIDIIELANQDIFNDEDEASLDDVFDTLDLSVLEELEEDEDYESQLEETSLEAVFGDQELVSLTDNEQSDVFTTNKQELETSLEKQRAESGSEDVSSTEIISSQDLQTSVSSLEELYAKLPGLKKESDLKTTAKPKNVSDFEKRKRENTTRDKKATKSNLTIRVDLERLERMNNLIGELSINRNGLSLQNDKLQTAVKDLITRFERFNQMATKLREMSDRMLIAPEKFGKQESERISINPLLGQDNINTESTFDSLEMDSYGGMYSATQGLIEQMIQLEEAVDDIALYAKQTGTTVENQRPMLNNIRDELMWARMLPLGDMLNRFPRVLRDLSVKHNKKVNLKLTGTGVLIDKSALEKLYDPLVHLLRNAFDHGIEPTETRIKNGKPEEGLIEIKAYHQGNQTVIEIADDGGGLNLEKIGKKALEKGLLSREQLSQAKENQLLDLIFEPGFSTADKVTDISGRGVGLDIVRSQLRSLKGNINVNSRHQKGTTLTLTLPLTLSIDKLLVLLAGSNFYALPSDNIEEILVPGATDIKISGDKRFLYYQKEIIPIYTLTDLLNYNCHTSSTMAMKSIAVLPVPDDWANPVLLLRQGQQLFAIEVDRLVSEQELVIKPFGSAMIAPSYIYGCTILGDGSLIPVINGGVLLDKFFSLTQKPTDGALGPTPREIFASNRSVNSGTVFQVSSVLVVDDSAAMRRTLSLSLEKAGYRVLQAKDGKEAIDQLTTNSNINLVICDIEMPNMNGFEFLGQRRRNPDMMKIPVAMLTSRSNDKHRKLATHLGADNYFTKPYIEQKFLTSIQTMIKQ